VRQVGHGLCKRLWVLGLTESSVCGRKKQGFFLRKSIGRQPFGTTRMTREEKTQSVARVAVELGHVLVAALNVRVLIPGRNMG
jgi:hypothetical protein